MSRVRCAIYTRVSSDEGLGQEFNSLDAQYEACKAYVASQRHEGWSLIKDRYDDGGFSGGSMERPGLQQAMADVAAGRIDVIVVYKIDRLTRSLTDFAKIVERLDAGKASFVSVTQAFNTNTSMGRLMLHVLLSFAQFEREVAAERVRDKIAASKAKGMWMGGTVPLGFDAIDRKLVVNESEAVTVRTIFTRFVELESVMATFRWARREGNRTKSRLRNGRQVGHRLFSYGAVRCILGNRLYAGEVEHKGHIYRGQHDAIVEKEVFDRAQTILERLGKTHGDGTKTPSDSLLIRRIVDCHGRTMGPVHTKRSGQRFRYYVTSAKAIGDGDPKPYRLAAKLLENIVCDLITEQMGSKVSSVEESIEAKKYATILSDGSAAERGAIVAEQLQKVIVGDGQLTLCFSDGTTITKAVQRVRHGNDTSFVVGELAETSSAECNPQLLTLLKDIERVKQLALAEPSLDLARLAERFGRSTERTKRLLRLASLSPTIMTAILEGRAPQRMTNRFLQNLDGLPLSWAEQDRLLLS